MQIFINEYIDLCSDDDDDDDVDTTKQNDDGHSSRKPRQSADSDDDLEIVSVSYPEKQKSAPAKSKETNGKKPDRCSNATSTMVRETKDIVIDALDATSSELLRQIDKFSIEEFKFADPHNYHANSDGDDEEKLFKRRNHELFKRRDVSVTGVKECTNQEASYNKAKERNSRRGQVSPSSLLDAISLDSSDEETSQIHRSAEVSSLANTAEKLGCKEIIGNSKMLTTNEKHRHSNEKLQSRPDLTSIKTKTTQCDLNNDIDNASNQNANIALTNPSISKSTDLTSIEDLSVEQLMSCTVANDERKSVNLEKLLIQLIQKLMQKTSSEPDSAPLSSMMQDTSSSAATLPPNPNNLHPTARTQVYQNNQAPSSTYNCQNSSALPPTTDGHSPFQMLANQRRLNLNDPRIRNELNKYKNSPLLAAGGIDISNLCNSVPTQTTLPIPYGQANPLNHPPIVNRGPSRLPTVVDPHTPASSYRQPLSQNYRLPQQYAMPNNMRHSHSNTTKSSITYAEYKRRKAEEQQRIAERQRQEITARSGTNVQPRPPNYHNIQTETENTSKEYMDKIEMQKRTEEIRSVLLQTLQPYTEKIEAMWESRNNRPTQDIPLNGDENPNTTTNPAIHLNAVNSNSLENNLNNMDKSKSIENEPIHSRPENQDLSKDPLENANPLSEPMNKEPPPHKSKETAKYKNSTHTSNGAIKNDKVTRLLKSLDYSTRDAEHGNMPKTIGLKRRSSIHARTAISRQLNAECKTRDNGDADSSSSTTKHQVSPPQPNITKRRKTIDDMPKTLLRKRRQSINTTPASVATALQNEQEKGEEEVQNKTNTEEVLRECAGSDSDLNDFEKFRMAKIQKLKDISSIGQPLIVLQRLTDCEIRNYSRCEENTQTTEENNNNTLSVLLVESKSHPANQDIVVDNGKKIATAKGKKVKPTKLNNNCKMTEANTRLCVLCSTRPADLTNHYVLRHKTESYVSRLTQHQIDDLSLNTPFAQELSNTNGRLIRYTVTCAFCKEELCESFMNLYNHYATHTGEYAFRCSGCKLDKPFRADIQSHQLHSRKCRGSSVLTMYRYPSSNMVIYLHYCTICNFVQLNEANVLKHLRDHHDNHQSTSANNIQKCILAAIRDGRSDNIKSSDPATPSGSSREYKDSVDCHKSNAKTEMEEVVAMSIDDHIPVENEAVAEEQHQSTMYSSLEDQLKQMHSDITCISPMTVIHCSSSSSKPIEDALESRNGMESIQGYSYVCKSEPIDDFEADRCLINICKSEPIDEDDDRPPTPPRPSLQKFTAKRYLPKYRLYPENVKYLGLYKCLWDDCYFSTDTKAEFIQHLEDHRSEHASELHLNCAYCNHFEEQLCTSSNQLAEHIDEEHLHMIYQCSACCYRSCEASNVLIHQEDSHASNIQSCVIYKCSGIERKVDDNYIHNKIMGNVGKLPCTCKILSQSHPWYIYIFIEILLQLVATSRSITPYYWINTLKWSTTFIMFNNSSTFPAFTALFQKRMMAC